MCHSKGRYFPKLGGKREPNFNPLWGMENPEQSFQCIDEMARDGVAGKRISGDGAGETGRSVKFMGILADGGIKGRSSAPRLPQSNGIPGRAIQQSMVIARSQIAKSGRGGDQHWMFAAPADAAYKTSSTLHEYLGGGTTRSRCKILPLCQTRCACSVGSVITNVVCMITSGRKASGVGARHL